MHSNSPGDYAHNQAFQTWLVKKALCVRQTVSVPGPSVETRGLLPALTWIMLPFWAAPDRMCGRGCGFFSPATARRSLSLYIIAERPTAGYPKHPQLRPIQLKRQPLQLFASRAIWRHSLDLKIFGVALVTQFLAVEGRFYFGPLWSEDRKNRGVLKFDRKFGLATKTGASALNFRELRDTAKTRQPAEIGRPLLDELD